MNPCQPASGRADQPAGRLHAQFRKPAPLVLAAEGKDLGLLDRKLINFLLSRRGAAAETRFEMPISEVLAYLGHGSTDRLRDSLRRLQTTGIRLPGQAVGEARYLRIEPPAGKGQLACGFHPSLFAVLAAPQAYAPLPLAVVRRFRSAYALRLFEVMALQQFKRRPVWEASLDVLRSTLGVTGYPRHDNLWARVVAPALAEVNALAGFRVDCQPVRRGRVGAVLGLRFSLAGPLPQTLGDISDLAAGVPPPDVGALARRRLTEHLKAHRPAMMWGVMAEAIRRGLSSDDLVAAEADFLARIGSGELHPAAAGSPAWRQLIGRLDAWAGRAPGFLPPERARRIEALRALPHDWPDGLPEALRRFGARQPGNLVAWMNAIRDSRRSPPLDAAVDYGMWLLGAAGGCTGLVAPAGRVVVGATTASGGASGTVERTTAAGTGAAAGAAATRAAGGRAA